MNAPIVTLAGATTDRGLRRELNEDSYLARAPYFLVSDGMGGHDAGEIASASVVAAFAAAPSALHVDMDDLQEVLADARRRVRDISGGRRGGAGATLAGVAVAELEGDGYWLAFNLGDSRIYRLGVRGFEQISVDHSVVQELVERGELAARDAATDRRRHVITRAIGAGSEAEADFWMIPASGGDRILVCSDGLTSEVADARIAAILRQEDDPQEAATALVAAAIAAGGRDNITVVVVDAVRVESRFAREIDEDTYDYSLADERTNPRRD